MEASELERMAREFLAAELPPERARRLLAGSPASYVSASSTQALRAIEAVLKRGSTVNPPSEDVVETVAQAIEQAFYAAVDSGTNNDGFRPIALAALAALRSPADVDLREALTPSAETKAAYSGEFSFVAGIGFDEDGHDISARFTVPWDTIKEIMAAVRARAALSSGEFQ